MRTLGDEWRERLLKTWLISRPDNQGSRKLVYLVEMRKEYLEYERKTYCEFFGFNTLIAKGSNPEFKYFRMNAEDFNIWRNWSYFKDKKCIKKIEYKLAKMMLTKYESEVFEMRASWIDDSQ
jgi:hypothetical protein